MKHITEQQAKQIRRRKTIDGVGITLIAFIPVVIVVFVSLRDGLVVGDSIISPLAMFTGASVVAFIAWVAWLARRLKP